MRKHPLHAALLLAAFALAAAAPAQAGDLVGHFGPDEVRLTSQPCTDASTIARIKPEELQAFHRATGLVDGKRFAGCWRNAGSVALIVWEDGDQGAVLFSQLRPALGI